MKKKFLILGNSGDGMYGFRRELLEALQQDADVTVSVPGDRTEELQSLGCRVLETPMDRRGMNPIKDMALIRQYWRMFRHVRPQLVVTYTIKPNIYGGIVSRMCRIPYAANITGLGTAFQGKGMLRWMVTLLYRAALKKAKVVFFENSANMTLFIQERIVAEDQCCLLNGAGVNLQRYALEEYPDAAEPVRFLFIGRVMAEKGIDELLTAAERLQKEGTPCHLDILGNYEEDYAEKLRRCEAQGWLTYHGFQKDVRPFIQKAHCFVLPSYHEGMANTNLECAAMGRPLITSDIPGCKEAVAENLSGYLCQSKNADSLYAAMKRFAQLSCADRAEMGKKGRLHMEAYFDKEKVVRKTVEHLLGE